MDSQSKDSPRIDFAVAPFEQKISLITIAKESRFIVAYKFLNVYKSVKMISSDRAEILTCTLIHSVITPTERVSNGIETM